MTDDDRIPFLTLGERAELYGLSYREQLALEQREPWVKHWSARYGRGAHNMRAFLAAGRPAADRDRLCVSGKPSMIRAVRAVVEKLPEAVAWHLVQTTAIACLSPGLGLTGPWPQPPPTPTTRIDITFTEPGLLAHEVAHGWHRDPSMWSGLTTAQIEAVDDAIATLPGADERDELAHLRELAADALARQWGFQVDTSGQRAARRQALMRGIEQPAAARDERERCAGDTGADVADRAAAAAKHNPDEGA